MCTGYETAWIRDWGYHVVGIDFSEESIQIAKSHSPDILFKVGGAIFELDLALFFQACIAIALVIHFTKDELITFFQRMSQYLVEDGKILVVIKVGSGMDQKAGTKKYNEKIYRRPVYLYTLQDV